jgi:outer membrane protein assembly factor BamE (lipoprotein component of BamABCDE complex)
LTVWRAGAIFRATIGQGSPSIKPPAAPSVLATSIAAAAVLFLTACSPPIEARGNLPDPVVLADVKPGVHTKEQVADLLGTPSSIAPFDKNLWYYIAQKTERIAFFKPDVLDQQVVSIKFDDKGLVQEIRRFKMDDGRDVDMVSRETPTRGRELSFMRSFLGSLGFLGRNPLGSGSGYQKDGRN